MKSLARFVRMTLAGGVLFLLPIVVLVMLLGKAMQVVHKLVLPLAAKIPVESVIGLDTPRMLAIVLLIAVCFLAGVLARTAVAGKATSKVEGILSNLPGYDFIKSLSMNLLSPDSVEKRPIVLARIEDSWQIATIVERIDANHVAVYVPGTPDPKAG
ncbi:MAG TPA: DUF502 domain-containing protein, partial [Candidatus Krumholzibacteria bacterium]|nr:DUF502 domain-containing protein [Candidatus Krumholzibacteria bacterium]